MRDLQKAHKGGPSNRKIMDMLQDDLSSQASFNISDIQYLRVQKVVEPVFRKNNLPDYLKKDHPNPDLLPCKDYIAHLPNHIDRPSVEQFNNVLTKLFKGISRGKPLLLKLRKKKKVHMDSAKERRLQKSEDKQYIDFFGKETPDDTNCALAIKRDYDFEEEAGTHERYLMRKRREMSTASAASRLAKSLSKSTDRISQGVSTAS